MRDRLYRQLLKVYRRLPVAARRRIVRWFSPSFTVGAVCFIERSDGALLLVRQVYRHGWGVPGGLLERREAPADAVRREILEEVGLVIDVVGEPAVVVDPVPQRVDLVFRGRVSDGESEDAVPSSPEIEAAAWFLPDELPDLQFETATALVTLARSAHTPQAHAISLPLTSDQRRSDVG
jgi:8-oxo-dGTP pyrophosphatase MutT (NUDIX family)